MKHVSGITPQDTWKGHLCTVEMRRLKSPTIRAALRKGHKFKIDLGMESLRTEVELGLEKYISHWATGRKANEATRQRLEEWKKAVLDEVQRKLTKLKYPLTPKGNSLHREAEVLGASIVFTKEDRAPHVVVAMCRKLYMQELNMEMQNQETFADVKETEEEILARHRKFQGERGLDTNERLPYPYGIWKSAKRKLRIISGVKKTQEDKRWGLKEKPQGSIAGVGTELGTLKEKDVEAMDRGAQESLVRHQCGRGGPAHKVQSRRAGSVEGLG